MKVYVLIELSHGEDPCSLDNTIVFADYEKAKKALKECYEATLDDVEGYDLLENEFDESSYEIQIDDGEWTQYHGAILEREVE